MIKTVTAGKKLHSKAQKHVLSLYRQMLRSCKNMDPSIKSGIQAEFRTNAQLPKSRLLQVEFFVRKAEKNLVLLKNKSNSIKGYTA